MSKFNKVYAVGVNAGEYLLLQETIFEQTLQATAEDIYIFNGKEKGNYWHSVGVDWLVVPGETPTKKPDIAGWGAMAFAVSESIVGKFREGLGDCCEFLPLDLNGESWFTLNILGEQDALNKALTEYNMRNGRINRVRRFKKLVLSKEHIKQGGLFKVAGAGLFTFCTDELGGLYDIATKNNFSGLKFSEVDFS